LSIGAADVLQQIVCSIKLRRAPTRHDNIDFRPVITRISKIKPLSVVVVADKGYASEDNHVMVREKLKEGFCIISPRHEKDVSIWKTRGKYRKEMKHGFQRFCTINVTKMKLSYQS
jgi:hypothetical protein